MTKHTPTPWKSEGARIIKGANGDVVGLCLLSGPHGKEADEVNAAYIVRAVNAHEELVRAIREIDEDLAYFDGTREELVSRIKAVVAQAIAKAEGK